MKNDSKELNTCICKCGSVSCKNTHIHSFSKQIPKNNDQFVYSVLHHKSLGVLDSKSIVIDRCCGNCLLFHCSICEEKFSIIKSQNSRYKFIFGFNPDCLTHIKPVYCNEKAFIPDFPLTLKSFVYLIKQKTNEKVCNKNSHLLNNTFRNFKNDGDDEILSFDSDENMMFGKEQTDLIIGMYNESLISSFKVKFHLLNNSFKYNENDDDEILKFDSDEDIMFGKVQTNFIIGKLNEASISSFGQSYSAF